VTGFHYPSTPAVLTGFTLGYIVFSTIKFGLTALVVLVKNNTIHRFLRNCAPHWTAWADLKTWAEVANNFQMPCEWSETS